jgi:competence protein ComEC
MDAWRRAPLFPMALAFVLGSLLSSTAITFIGWGALPLLLLWLWHREVWLFWVCLVALGCFYTQLRRDLVSPHDVRLLPMTKFEEATQWRGLIVSAPEYLQDQSDPTRGRTELIFQIEAWSPPLTQKFFPATGQLLLRVPSVSPTAWSYGDKLIVTAALQEPTTARNPGQLNFAKIIQQRGLAYVLRASTDQVQLTAQHRGYPWIAWALQTRAWAYQQLHHGLETDPQATAVLAGMLFGYRDNLDPNLENKFRQTGTYHIFAVSGQNVAVILTVILLFLHLLGFLRWNWGWLAVPALTCYCLMSGSQPSAVRALWMALLVLWAWRLRRPVSALNLWSAALLALLIVEPIALQQVGFLLSFMVVLSLIVLTPKLTDWAHQPFAIDDFLPRPLWTAWQVCWHRASWTGAGLSAAGLAAWLGSLPISVWIFHQISPIALWANLVVVPLASLIVIVGTLGLSSALLQHNALVLLNQLNGFLVNALIAVVSFFAAIPYGSGYVADFASWPTPKAPQFIFLQTQETTTALLRYQNQSWLINTGSKDDYRSVLNPARQYFGINRLDGIILGQLSGPTAGGVISLQNDLRVGQWFLPPTATRAPFLKTWLGQMAETLKPKTFLWRGHELRWDKDFGLQVLAPELLNLGARAEDSALVMKFSYQQKSLLWAGNMGLSQEMQLLNTYPNLQTDVLVQGLHPTEKSLSLGWLLQLQPKHVIQSAPSTFRPYELRRDPLAGLPEPSRPSWWRQDRTGAVTVTLDSNQLTVEPFLAQSKPSASH